MVQMITGHNRLNRHQSLMEPGISPTCRLCREEDESSWHLIGECPMLRTKRWEYLGGPCLDNPPDWSPSKLLKFLHKAKIDEMNIREENPLSQIPWTGFRTQTQVRAKFRRSGIMRGPRNWNSWLWTDQTAQPGGMSEPCTSNKQRNKQT